jgi:hypothetical protein
MPRRRWVGSTVTAVIASAATDPPPGTDTLVASERNVPTTRSSSKAPRHRLRSVNGRRKAASAWVSRSWKKATWMTWIQAASSASLIGRISMDMMRAPLGSASLYPSPCPVAGQGARSGGPDVVTGPPPRTPCGAAAANAVAAAGGPTWGRRS